MAKLLYPGKFSKQEWSVIQGDLRKRQKTLSLCDAQKYDLLPFSPNGLASYVLSPGKPLMAGT